MISNVVNNHLNYFVKHACNSKVQIEKSIIFYISNYNQQMIFLLVLAHIFSMKIRPNYLSFFVNFLAKNGV